MACAVTFDGTSTGAIAHGAWCTQLSTSWRLSKPLPEDLQADEVSIPLSSVVSVRRTRAMALLRLKVVGRVAMVGPEVDGPIASLSNVSAAAAALGD